MTRALSTLAVLVSLALIGLHGQVRQPLLGVSTADALFDDSVVHELRLTVNSNDWATLKARYLENTYYTADLRWRDQLVRNVGIRQRGTGSRSPIKPGLTVNFARYVTDQRFLGLSQVVLRNNTQDPSNLRERLAMLLFQRMGVPASREAHARLYVNEEYVGLYTIVERLDAAFLRRTFDDSEGYLFSYDYPADAAPYYFEYRGEAPSLYVPRPFSPETQTSDPQPQAIVDLVKTVNLTSDTAFRLDMQRQFDLPAFMRHMAVDQFLQDDDGVIGDYGMNNAYLYRQRGVFSFIPWDKSNAFTGGFSRSIWHNITDVPIQIRNRLMWRAVQYPDLARVFLDSLLDCVRLTNEAQPDGRTWLAAEIEREYAQVRAWALADPVKPFTNDQFEASVDELRGFARSRGAFVTTEVQTARARLERQLGRSRQ
jgi:CotH kinase protein